MEYIKKEELIEGEIYYVSTTYGFWMIGLVTKSNNGDNDYSSFRGNATYISKDEDFNKDKSWCYKASDRTYRLATSEEKHWLETCIKADKFISYEEAMKTFIPEYVECVGETNYGFYGKLGTIYKVINWNHLPNDCMLEGTTSGSTSKNRFKPSTKEAYDAQFIVKEPEFVLPEKWCIFRNNEHFEEIGRWFNKINDDDSYTNSIIKSNYPYLNNSGIQGNCLSTTLINGYIEITFEQFKKYVLKEEIVVEEVIEQPITENKTELEIWLENTKSLNLSLEDLEKYIESGQTCNFDNIYMKLEGHHSKGRAKILFDKWNEKVIEPLPQFKIIETIETITKVENNEGNQFFIGDVVKTEAGLHFKIIGFKYNENKTKILAIATDNYPEVVKDINDIEHYIEPKVEETLLEKAKIIEHSHDFKIGDKIKLKLDNGEFNFVFKIIKIEGNVLFFGNSIHSRVLAKNAIKVN